MFESRYHNGEYLQNNPSWGAEDSAWKAEKIIDLIKKNNLSPTSVVEVGCQFGNTLMVQYLVRVMKSLSKLIDSVLKKTKEI